MDALLNMVLEWSVSETCVKNMAARKNSSEVSNNDFDSKWKATD